MKVNNHANQKGFYMNATTRSARQRWMIVDDDRDLLLLMKQMLELVTDAEIVCFHNSVEALLTLQVSAGSFDRVITDYHMPGMNGMELCRRVRIFAPHLNITLATSDTDVTKGEALRNGFDHLLRKPFAFESLCEVLEENVEEPAVPARSVTPEPAWAANARRMMAVAMPAAACAAWIVSF